MVSLSKYANIRRFLETGLFTDKEIAFLAECTLQEVYKNRWIIKNKSKTDRSFAEYVTDAINS